MKAPTRDEPQKQSTESKIAELTQMRKPLAQQSQNTTQDTNQQDIQKMEKLQEEHERVVSMILEEEESIISTHKKNLDELVDSVKE